jgi:hypothetical protein
MPVLEWLLGVIYCHEQKSSFIVLHPTQDATVLSSHLDLRRSMVQ